MWHKAVRRIAKLDVPYSRYSCHECHQFTLLIPEVEFCVCFSRRARGQSRPRRSTQQLLDQTRQSVILPSKYPSVSSWSHCCLLHASRQSDQDVNPDQPPALGNTTGNVWGGTTILDWTQESAVAGESWVVIPHLNDIDPQSINASFYFRNIWLFGCLFVFCFTW